MDIKAQLPTLEDAELTNMLDNAQRLLVSGTDKQRTAAAAMMPAIEAECASRAAAKVARRNEALAARRAAKSPAARNVAAGTEGNDRS